MMPGEEELDITLIRASEGFVPRPGTVDGLGVDTQGSSNGEAVRVLFRVTGEESRMCRFEGDFVALAKGSDSMESGKSD